MTSANPGGSARFALRLHPQSPRSPVSALSVEIRPDGDALCLRYALLGDLSSIRFPAVTTPARGEELWRHTCLECFLGVDDGRYFEFNFSPSLAWAAYEFTGYRAGGQDFAAGQPPGIATSGNSIQYLLDARLGGALLQPWRAAGARRIALSAVIEDRDGQQSWWALRHPSATPDFHHADGFVLWQD